MWVCLENRWISHPFLVVIHWGKKVEKNHWIGVPTMLKLGTSDYDDSCVYLMTKYCNMLQFTQEVCHEKNKNI